MERKKLFLNPIIGRLFIGRFLKDLDIGDIVLALGKFFCLEDILTVLTDCNTPVFIPYFNLNRLFIGLAFKLD